MNNFVPMDDLNWNDASKSYQILSSDDQNEIIKACLSFGIEDPKDIAKVVREYETVRGGLLIFKNFVAGRLGICGFDADDSPIFETRDAE
jgi:hypothetical protein